MARRPTIIDVARQAGVSKSTVSLVLQNSPAVKAETRAQVRAAMAQLGYVYNRAAANMRMSNAGLVGLVINDLRNPFFTEFATSLQMELAERGYASVIANTDEDPLTQDNVVRTIIEHGVSALIICPAYGQTQATFAALRRAGIPTLQMLRRSDATDDPVPLIAPDYLSGSRAATQHLVRTGARRIAFAGGLEGRAVTQERQAGYLQVLAEHGLAPLVLTGKATRAFGRAAAAELLARPDPVDAVLCFNDLVALGILSTCHELGCAVGQQFQVIGFDDIEEATQIFPTLSTVRCDIAGIGRLAAGTVIDWIENGVQPALETRTPVELILRQSTRA